jgi:hypothetical protein
MTRISEDRYTRRPWWPPSFWGGGYESGERIVNSDSAGSPISPLIDGSAYSILAARLPYS